MPAASREIVEVRPAAGGDEEMGAFDRLGARGRGEGDLHPGEYPPHIRGLDPGAQLDALAFEGIEHDRGAFRIFARERCRCFEYADLRAQATERLRQFEPDRPGADDDQMTRKLGEIGEAFAGEMRRVEEAGNRRNDRRRAGRDNEPVRLDREVVDGERIRIGKTRCAGDHAHTEAGEALAGKVRCHRLDHLAHMGADRCVIDADAHRLGAEARAGAHCVGVLRGGDQRLCRHAAVPLEEADAHAAIFDEHGRHAQGGGRRGDSKAAGIGADYADFRFELLRHPPATAPAAFVSLYTWEYGLMQELGSTAGTGGKPASRSR